MFFRTLIDHDVEKIIKGEITSEEAGMKITKPCLRGIFNVPRATGMLEKMATPTVKE